MALFEALSSLYGQVAAAAVAGLFWCIFIETINGPLRQFVKSKSWWMSALPPMKAMMCNFGYPKDEITEQMALESFCWVITMCITHICSASLMFPAILYGWEGAGAWGQLSFLLGVLSEVGFDCYDGPKMFLQAFLADRFPWVGEAVPRLSFILIVGLHHTSVLTMAIPMNTKYIHLPQYHWIAFSLLFSAGVCYMAGHYKFTVDAKTPGGLQTCKAIVMLQFVMNLISRLFIFFPAAYSVLTTFHKNGDTAFLYGGGVGMIFMGLYNLIVVSDATQTAIKWSQKTVKEE